ncbi:MAG: IS4 family transposase [Methanobrevibacter sp.]|nr:IS4 family transposase [Methanobrevibacter sp.]
MVFDNIVKEFFEFIETDEFLNIAKLKPSAFTRKRKMECSNLIHFMITRGSNNTTVELDKYSKDMGIQPVSRQAYSLSRRQIKPISLKYLNTWLIDKIYELQDYKTWKNYLILTIDGYLLNLPWIEELKEEYGGIAGKDHEITAIKAQSSGLYDCLNEIMIDFEVKPYQVSEKTLALKNIENSIETIKNKNPLITFDKNYASLELFNYLLKSKINFLFRVKKTDYTKERNNMESDDEFINIIVTDSRINHIKDPELKEELKEIKQINLRVTRIILDSEEEKFVISNLPMEKFDTNDLKELHNLRWEIETSYNTLKNSLEVEKITAKKRLTVEQDYYSKIINYNLSKEQ